MRTRFRVVIIGSLAFVVLGIVFVPLAAAQCASPQWHNAGSLQPQAWREPAPVPRASFVLTGGQEGADDRIVGFWKVKFLSDGNPGIPDGAVIDNGFVQWHSDGTEIMNSSRPPATGNFCLGVWQKSGPSSYQINHFALSSDPAGDFIGPAQIREHVTLNNKANQYEGTFTIDQYDAAGNPLAHITGRVTGKRVDVDTTIGEVL